MAEDEEPLTLTPVYRFEWSDGAVRRTDDDDAIEDEEWPHPAAVEALAAEARADDACEVTLVGMGQAA